MGAARDRILVAVPVWMLGLRRTPIVDRSVMLKFAPMAALHAAGHALQVAGIGAGSVYFGTVIKATEPLIERRSPSLPPARWRRGTSI